MARQPEKLFAIRRRPRCDKKTDQEFGIRVNLIGPSVKRKKTLEIRRIGRIGAIDDIVSDLLGLHIPRAADRHPSQCDQVSGHRIAEDKSVRQFPRGGQLGEIWMGLEQERSHLKNVALYLSEHLIGNW